MRYHKSDIVLQEVPGEISLSFSITGCSLHCAGCHSPELWSRKNGQPLTPKVFAEHLDRYSGLITAVLFLGGEWFPQELVQYLRTARSRGLRTCLYTGLDEIDPLIRNELDYLKLGPWRAEMGGLEAPGTNQRFLNLKTGELLNHLFQHPEVKEGICT